MGREGDPYRSQRPKLPSESPTDHVEILLSKIRTYALNEMSKSLEGEGAEDLLRSHLIEKYNVSADECHLLERWVTGELIRLIAREL